MDIWVIVRNQHGELTTSTHLTEKGALLLALNEVIEYLSIHTEHNYENFLRSHNLDDAPVPLAIWNQDDLADTPTSVLWDVWGFWSDFWWGQNVDWLIERTQVQA